MGFIYALIEISAVRPDIALLQSFANFWNRELSMTIEWKTFIELCKTSDEISQRKLRNRV